MNYKCLKCERVYNKNQLNLQKTIESSRIISFIYLCPLCNTSQFELRKEIYLKLGEKVLENLKKRGLKLTTMSKIFAK